MVKASGVLTPPPKPGDSGRRRTRHNDQRQGRHRAGAGASYDRVTKNALDDIERKQIQPTVYNWGGGDVDYEYRGDGYVLDQKFRPGSFICLNDTDVNQTCWGENGTMWKRHWGPVPGGGGPSDWLYDGPDPNHTVFLRKRWPGEAAPDLFK